MGTSQVSELLILVTNKKVIWSGLIQQEWQLVEQKHSAPWTSYGAVNNKKNSEVVTGEE